MDGLPTPYYADESVRLYHADCIGALEHLDAEGFGVMLTDPPYGIQYSSGARRQALAASIAGDEDTSLRDAALKWWGDRAALVFGSWKKPRPKATHTRLVWDTKGALGMGNLSVPWKPSDQEIYVLGYGFEGRRSSNVLTCAPVQSTAKNGRLHPHQKPLPLLGMLLRKCPAGVVLDPFAGSGSTLVAAKRMGRQAVGFEVDEGYCQAAARRLSQIELFAPRASIAA